MTTRKEKMEEITTMLEDGVKAIFESGAYENYLKVMSRFHRYSPRNSILIAMQNPEATLVAGYQSWRKNFNRYVRRGEKAIEILAPMQLKLARDKDDNLAEERNDSMQDNVQVNEEDERIITSFRPAYVFDIGQTEGDPLPKIAKDLYGEVKDYAKMIAAFEVASPVPIEFGKTGGADGYYSLTDKKIVVSEGMSEPQTVAALVHEISHAMLHDRNLDDVKANPEPLKDSRTKEVEAESIAYVVCQYFGIETGENSFGYIASWSKDKELPELYASLETIRGTASGIIEKAEKELTKDMNYELTGDLMKVCEPSFYSFEERGKER